MKYVLVHGVKDIVLLFVMSAVSPLSGLHSTSGMAFEVLPQSRARGKAFGTRLTPKILIGSDCFCCCYTPVWFISRVYSTMVDQIPLRTEGLSTLRAGKWSLSSVLAHVHWGSCVRQ